MRVFVTGSGGHIGTAVVTELVRAGHEVLGLVRSDRSAAAVTALGAEAVRGDVNDPALLAATAARVDAVVHLAFDNAAAATGGIAGAATADQAVIDALADALAGTGKTLVGIGIATTGDPERDRIMEQNPRAFVARSIMALGDRGIRQMLVAVPPVTHSDRDTGGFVPTLIRIARDRGVSGYVDAGTNTWPAVHTLDLAVLFRLTVEQAPAGAQLIGAAEPGVEVRAIAASIGEHLGAPTVSVPAAEAAAHFAPFPFMGMDVVFPNEATRELLGWTPTHPTLLEDLDAGHYFA